MSEQDREPRPDPELERRLDAAFAAARPPAGLEGRLWRTLQRRGWWRRATFGLSGLSRPAWAAMGAVAAVLILAVALIPTLGHLRAGGSADSGGSAASARAGAAAPAPLAKLPAPALRGPNTGSAHAGSSHAPAAGAGGVEVGVELPALPAQLPVWTFKVPDPATFRARAAAVGAAPYSPPAGYREPLVQVSAGAGAGGPVEAYLRAHGLFPDWPALVQAGAAVTVYVHQFAVPGGLAPQVDQSGQPAGTAVQLAGAGAVGAVAPLPGLELTAISYPALNPGEVSQALGGTTAAGAGPTAARLTSATLVYIAVDGGAGIGYYEPALLLRGASSAGSELRLLVPAIQAHFLR
ncbi:MAG: hypothetical protein M3024_16425 [Candidatus Dormibacteraeota bacterium]|nr:hypothetical protein [Candidatus Dormibacteraeota bacterium]